MPTTWKITVKAEGLGFKPNVRVNVPAKPWGDEPPAPDQPLLVIGEDVKTPTTDAELHHALYDLYQVEDAIEDGDIFELAGRPFAYCEGVHVRLIPDQFGPGSLELEINSALAEAFAAIPADLRGVVF